MLQRIEQWHQDRCGAITASRFKDVLSKGRGKAPSATRQAYIGYVVAERLTGTPQDTFSNKAMSHGTETEEQGIAAYEWNTGYEVVRTGFIRSPEQPYCGASPDGLIADSDDGPGGLELKCPASTAVHLANAVKLKTPSEYVAQVQGGMLVTGAQWWDFGSFDPRMPFKTQLVIVRVPRDEEFIKQLSEALAAFEDECQALYQEMSDEIPGTTE